MLDDEAFARAWVESRDRARPRGERAIREELRLKGIDRETVDVVLGERRDRRCGEDAGDDGRRRAAAQRGPDRGGTPPRKERPGPGPRRGPAPAPPARLRPAWPATASIRRRCRRCRGDPGRCPDEASDCGMTARRRSCCRRTPPRSRRPTHPHRPRSHHDRRRRHGCCADHGQGTSWRPEPSILARGQMSRPAYAGCHHRYSGARGSASMLKRRSRWLAGTAGLFLVLSMSGVAMGVTPPDAVPDVDTTLTFEDIDGNGVDDDCQDVAAVDDADAVAASDAPAADLNGDGVLSPTSEAAQSARTGGKNCNHGGYVSQIAKALDECEGPGDHARGHRPCGPPDRLDRQHARLRPQGSRRPRTATRTRTATSPSTSPTVTRTARAPLRAPRSTSADMAAHQAVKDARRRRACRGQGRTRCGQAAERKALHDAAKAGNALHSARPPRLTVPPPRQPTRPRPRTGSTAPDRPPVQDPNEHTATASDPPEPLLRVRRCRCSHPSRNPSVDPLEPRP